MYRSMIGSSAPYIYMHLRDRMRERVTESVDGSCMNLV